MKPASLTQLDVALGVLLLAPTKTLVVSAE